MTTPTVRLTTIDRRILLDDEPRKEVFTVSGATAPTQKVSETLCVEVESEEWAFLNHLLENYLTGKTSADHFLQSFIEVGVGVLPETIEKPCYQGCHRPETIKTPAGKHREDHSPSAEPVLPLFTKATHGTSETPFSLEETLTNLWNRGLKAQAQVKRAVESAGSLHKSMRTTDLYLNEYLKAFQPPAAEVKNPTPQELLPETGMLPDAVKEKVMEAREMAEVLVEDARKRVGSYLKQDLSEGGSLADFNHVVRLPQEEASLGGDREVKECLEDTYPEDWPQDSDVPLTIEEEERLNAIYRSHFTS